VAAENNETEIGNTAEAKETNEVVLNLAFDSFIPETYIPHEDERMKVYMAVSKINSEHERDGIIEHLNDLYGKPPPEVHNIVTAGYIRMLANKLDIKHISLTRGQDAECRITFADGIDQHALIKKIEAAAKNQAVLYQGLNLAARLTKPSLQGLISFLEKLNQYKLSFLLLKVF
jgi:transcription-repair coupling factor (superfamily II helicase)